MKPIIRVSVGHDGAHFAADWDLEKIEVQEILNDGEDIYGSTLQFKEWSFELQLFPTIAHGPSFKAPAVVGTQMLHMICTWYVHDMYMICTWYVYDIGKIISNDFESLINV